MYLKFRDRRVLRVRAGVGRRGAGDRRRRRDRRPARARRRRHEAVARAPRRGAARRRARRTRRRSGAPPTRSWPPRSSAAHNAFKVELAARAAVRALSAGWRAMSADRHAGRRASTARPRSPARARYTAEVALPGLTHLAIVGATIASGRVTAIDAARRVAWPTASSPSSPTRTCRRSRARRSCCPPSLGQAGARRELLPDAGRRRALRGPAGRARRRRHPRARAARRVAGARRLRRRAVDHHHRRGARGRRTRPSGCSAG